MMRGIRHLHDIPGLVDVEQGRRDWWIDDSPKTARIVADRLERRSRAQASSRANVSESMASYLNSAQHDAWILGHLRKGDRFTLTAGDENALMLASHGYGVVAEDAVYPFDLVFGGVSHVGWLLREKDGRLRRTGSPMRSPHRASWFRDTFIEPDRPGIRWALAYHQPDGRFSSRVLLVEAETMRVVERQREAWIRHVGVESLPIFEESQSRRRDFPLTHPQNLTAFLQEHGLVRPQSIGPAAGDPVTGPQA
ncbi:hypothetical protein EON79_04400 [bacterium]|nr:MAG: hypothetical protein EON79_04400 [bacterium]